jgi:hypothetical protein
MLGLQALDCYQTATLAGSPGSYADLKESTIIDARYVECFTFCRHVLLQCAALCCDTHASHRRRQHLRVQ